MLNLLFVIGGQILGGEHLCGPNNGNERKRFSYEFPSEILDYMFMSQLTK